MSLNKNKAKNDKNSDEEYKDDQNLKNFLRHVLMSVSPKRFEPIEYARIIGKSAEELKEILPQWMETYAAMHPKAYTLSFMLDVIYKAKWSSTNSSSDRAKDIATLVQNLAYIHVSDCILPRKTQGQHATCSASSPEFTEVARAWVAYFSVECLEEGHQAIMAEMWSELVDSSLGSSSFRKIERKLAVVKIFEECMKDEDQRETLKRAHRHHSVDTTHMLLQLYIDVSAMEGLEVSFTTDALQTRKVITDILLFFWRHENHDTVDEDFFTDFLRAVLETIVLVLNQYCCDTNPHAENQKNPLVAARDVHLELFNLLVKEETMVDRLCGSRLLALFTTAFSIMALNVLQHLPHEEKRDWQSFANLLENLLQNEKFLSEVVIRTDAFAACFCLAVVFHPQTGILEKSDGVRKLIEKTFSLREKIWRRTYREGRRWIEKNLKKYNLNDLKNTYENKMKTTCFTKTLLEQSHSFRAILEKYDPTSIKISHLEQEIKTMQEELPCQPDKAIFVVRDSQRYDVLRCVVSGPVGTPYSRGLFVFDVYCPDGYPSVPPLVRFLTTGYGTADFHACLHSSGEVFLNLLGTGSEDDGSGPWKPGESTLCDVLTSIQTLILSDKPLSSYHHSGSQGDEERIKHHESYLPVLTVRYAMLEHLLNPPIGLQGLIGQHFSVQREAVLSQCAEWLQTKSRYNYELTWDCEVLREKLMGLNDEAQQS